MLIIIYYQCYYLYFYSVSYAYCTIRVQAVKLSTIKLKKKIVSDILKCVYQK